MRRLAIPDLPASSSSSWIEGQCLIAQFAAKHIHTHERETNQTDQLQENMKVLAIVTLALVALAATGVHAEEGPAERNLRQDDNKGLVPKASSHLSDVIARIKTRLGLGEAHSDMAMEAKTKASASALGNWESYYKHKPASAMESAPDKLNKKVKSVTKDNIFTMESKQHQQQHHDQ